MRKYHTSYIILTVILLIALVITYTPKKEGTQTLATVGDTVITESDLDLYLES